MWSEKQNPERIPNFLFHIFGSGSEVTNRYPQESEDLVDEYFIFVLFLLAIELCSLHVEPILGFSFDNFVKSITQRIEVF